VATTEFERSALAWPAAATAAVRAGFGVLWAINAYLTWRPEFAAHYVGYLQNAAQGQPIWLAPWFTFWINLVTPNADLFVWLTRIIETLIAIGLLLGLLRLPVYVAGALFSLLIWATAEGFSGPYATGVANIGPALVYVLLFVALILLGWGQGASPYSLDYYIERRWPGWRRLSEPSGRRPMGHPARILPWPEQALAIAVIAGALIFLLGGLQSATSAAAPTPKNAAAAVTPLQLASSNPIANPRDATLPPLLGTGDQVSVNLVATDTNVEIASGVAYEAWTFNDTVPAPILHVRQGQTVNVTFTNDGTMQHSIDFHAAQIDPAVAYRNADPGQSVQFSFVAEVPGVFMYHCGTAPVLFHIGNGMYGAIVVDPTTPLPPADVSYVLVQSEWYTKQIQGNTMGPDYVKMQQAIPDLVVFNGAAFQYRDHPLTAHAGQRVRLYVVNAGPSQWSAPHVIGGIFANVYPDGDPAHALSGVSTYSIAPGAGAILDVVIPKPGEYPIVDHSMRDSYLGASGILKVLP